MKGVEPSKPSKPAVSIVIVTFDSRSEIGPCLDSISPSLDSDRCEAIIIDNASSDGTVEISRRRHQNLSLIENATNVGFTRAVNQGIDAAHADVIYILNPDTELAENSIRVLREKLLSDASIGAVAPQLRFPDGRIQHSCRRFPTHWNILTELSGISRLTRRSRLLNGWKMGDFDHEGEREVDQPAGAALMVRRDVLTELGGLDERFPMFFSDVDLCKRIKDSGWRILFWPEAKVTHKGGSTIFQRRPAMIVTSHLSLIKYFLKHFRRPAHVISNFIIALLLVAGIPIRLLVNMLIPAKQSERQNL